MRHYRFITTLRFLKITESIPNKFTLMPGIDLITDKAQISKILDDEFKMIAGVIEAEHFENANHIICCDIDEETFNHPFSSNQALIVWLVWLDLLIQDAWLVKDHAISCDIAFARMTNGQHSEWSSNYLNSQNYLSSGQAHVNVEFDFEDIKVWETKSNAIQTYLHQKKSGALNSFINKEFSRIGRSLRFISAARKETHPAIKITHYCSAFESLFSTDNSELSHKLAERIAIFLKQYGFEPLAIFDDVKAFYTVRSKVTHGDSIQGKRANDISDLSQKCDNYLRYIINKIVDDPNHKSTFDDKKEIIEQYFKELILLK